MVSQSRKQTVWWVGFLFFGSVLTVFPKDFWEEKPFTQWNEEESMKLLSESPWARTLTVLGSILGAGQAGNNRISDLPNVATASGGRSSGTAMSTGTAMGQAGGFGPSDPVPLYVRWYSSVRIRQALGRLGQIQSNAAESEVKKFAEQPMEEYVIAVIAPVMNSFNDVTLEDFKQKTFLTSKKDKSKKIPLKSYVAPKDRNDGTAAFSFPRLIEGSPAFGPEDQEVEFVAQGRKVNIKTSFKLAKMVADGKPDL